MPVSSFANVTFGTFLFSINCNQFGIIEFDWSSSIQIPNIKVRVNWLSPISFPSPSSHSVGKQIVNVPSFVVRLDSQKHIDFALTSPYGGARAGRVKRKRAKAAEAKESGDGGDDEEEE